MADRVEALRLQVSAAEFLLRSLQAQLRKAEEEVAVSQQGNGVQGQVAGSNNITPDTGGNEGTHDTGLNVVGESVLPQANGFPEDIDITDAGASEDEDAPNEPVDDSPQAFQLPPLEVGTMYPNLEEVKKATIAYAISQGWTCGVDKRDKTRLLLKCRTSPACPFFLRAEQYADAARIASYRPGHTCTFQPDQSHVPRAHTTQLRFMREQLPNFLTVTGSTTPQEICEAIYQRFGTRVSLKQCRSLCIGPKRYRTPSLGTCSVCGQVGHNKKTCSRTQVS
jgi:hypothetical protein